MNQVFYKYFKLQFKRARRSIIEAGFPIILFYPAFLGIYFLLYKFLILSPNWSVYLITLLNIQTLFSLSDFSRIDFLKITFIKSDFYIIRWIENLLFGAGTILILILSHHYMYAVINFMLSIVFVFSRSPSIWGRSIPTPFKKKPFEFILGLRKTWLILIIIYSLSIIGFAYGNENLILFCVFCLCLCACTYYQEPENLIILWNNNRKPKSFLSYKICRGVYQLTLLLSPIGLFFLILFPESYLKIMLILVLGYLLITFIVCLKYAVFPRKINVTDALIVGLCLTFFPLILAIIPYYIIKAIQNLKNLP